MNPKNLLNLSRLIPFFAISALPITGVAQLSVATHSAIVRDGAKAWVLRVNGSGADVQTGMTAPRHAVNFRDRNGAAFRWPRLPLSFARWQGRWLVVNGTDAVYEFGADGTFVKSTPLPVAATDVVASDDCVWIYRSAAGVAVYVATKDLQFGVVRSQSATPGLDASQMAINAIRLLAAAPSTTLLYTHLVGPPILHHLKASGGHSQTPLAYRRTTRRASLTKADVNVNELEYSAPARDIVPISAVRVLVLRNLEDEPGPKGTVPFVGRRADLYRLPDGAHLGTATFPEPARWLLRAQDGAVTAIARSGRIIEARIAKPLPGAIVPIERGR